MKLSICRDYVKEFTWVITQPNVSNNPKTKKNCLSTVNYQILKGTYKNGSNVLIWNLEIKIEEKEYNW